MAMSGSGHPTGSSMPVEDSFFELLIDTLEGLDQPARGLFLQRLLKSLTQLDLTESESLETWDRIIERRRELARLLGRPVAMKTAMVDFLATSNMLRAPILMEYEDLKKLHVNAATDPLTGLYNRRLFEDYFEKELDRARRYDLSLALIILDLHVFKMVNDRYGHPKGDQVLQQAAKTMSVSMRTSDFAFRIGGDEFALLLPQADAEQAGTLGRRIHNKFAGVLQPLHLDIPLGLDYGLAVYPQDGDRPEVLLRVADERLYQMKYSTRTQAEVDSTKASAERRTSRAGTKPNSTSQAGDGDGVGIPAAEQPTIPEDVAEPEKSSALESPQSDAPAQSTPEPQAQPGTTPDARSLSERRRWERISLTGKRAFATVGDGQENPLRVLDMSHGGVALEAGENLPTGESFQAVLQVPILGEVRVKLKKLYVNQTEGQQSRVGCLFIT
jgi:diguanylate cyclase (GGDEF)-like protein